MTIKLPEPRKVTGTEVGYYYTEKDLKQAIRDALEEAAKEFEHFGGFKDGYSCASRLRELKEQLK